MAQSIAKVEPTSNKVYATHSLRRIFMPSTAVSTPNIALIKYWGNRNDRLRLPAGDSLSMALDTPTVEITVDHAPALVVRSFLQDGSEKKLDASVIQRYETVLELYRRYFVELGLVKALPQSLSIVIRSGIPPSIGIASSAAVFSCLAEAVADLVKDHRVLDRKQVSVLARLGSGSACRGAYDGYVAIRAGKGEAIDAAYAEQIADAQHWLLHDTILVPSHEAKKVGSTEGHTMAHTSPHFTQRVQDTPRRMRECTHAIRNRDFEKLQFIAEEDALNMHHVMQTQTPPLHYLSSETLRILDEVKSLRKRKHLPVLFTMDAGPTVHLFCPDEALADVLDFAKSQSGCQVFSAKTGRGSFVQT